jgi:hypothetical protein
VAFSYRAQEAYTSQTVSSQYKESGLVLDYNFIREITEDQDLSDDKMIGFVDKLFAQIVQAPILNEENIIQNTNTNVNNKKKIELKEDYDEIINKHKSNNKSNKSNEDEIDFEMIKEKFEYSIDPEKVRREVNMEIEREKMEFKIEEEKRKKIKAEKEKKKRAEFEVKKREMQRKQQQKLRQNNNYGYE